MASQVVSQPFEQYDIMAEQSKKIHHYSNDYPQEDVLPPLQK